MQQKLTKAIVILASAGLLALYQHFQPADKQAASKPPAPVAAETQTGKPASKTDSNDYRQTIDKIRQSQTNPDAKFWTTIQGEVVKLLTDDREGSPHQRFLLEISPDITLLVAHNIELAPRVPVQAGQPVTVSGEYVWNNRGGVMHWTHHDPKGRRGGWIEYGGKRYQ